MQFRRVLDRDQVVADPIDDAEPEHRGGGVVEQRPLECGIGPGFGYDARADMRAHLGLVGLDDGVEGGRIDIAFFGQHGFQRPHAQLHFGEL
jgi:hypothetical protein